MPCFFVMDISAYLEAMDIFGSKNPKTMPLHFFSGAVHIAYETAIRANVSRQNFSVAPRHWYIECDFHCSVCRQEFTWTAGEQKVWFETFGFYVDSSPRLCKKCAKARRGLAALRREYEATVYAARHHGNAGQKQRIVAILTTLQDSGLGLPAKMLATRTLFEQQIKKAAALAASSGRADPSGE